MKSHVTRWLAALAIAACAFASPALADDATPAEPPAKPQAAGKSSAAPDNGGHNPFGDAIEYAQRRTVKLIGAGAGREHGYASAIIVSGDGHILTAHGIYVSGDLNARLQIIMPDGRVYPAVIERRSDALQVVLLKIDAKTPEFFELPEKPNVEKGDWVLSVTNAFKVADRDEPLSVNMGVVSLRTEIDAKKRSQDVEIDGQMLLIDAITSNPGAPGGALMTIDKKLAGMVGKIIESKSTNTRLNYAIPSDRLREFMDNKAAPSIAVNPPTGSHGKPDLGIRLFRLSGKRAPAFIDRIIPGSPADKAGIMKDDMILRIGNDFVSNIKDYDDIAGALRVGEEVTVIYKRKNEVLTARLAPTAEKVE
jgi:serine protease Do